MSRTARATSAAWTGMGRPTTSTRGVMTSRTEVSRSSSSAAQDMLLLVVGQRRRRRAPERLMWRAALR